MWGVSVESFNSSPTRERSFPHFLKRRGNSLNKSIEKEEETYLTVGDEARKRDSTTGGGGGPRGCLWLAEEEEEKK